MARWRFRSVNICKPPYSCRWLFSSSPTHTTVRARAHSHTHVPIHTRTHTHTQPHTRAHTFKREYIRTTIIHIRIRVIVSTTHTTTLAYNWLAFCAAPGNATALPFPLGGGLYQHCHVMTMPSVASYHTSLLCVCLGCLAMTHNSPCCYVPIPYWPSTARSLL